MTTLLPSSSWLRRTRDLGLLVCHCGDPRPELVCLFGWIPVVGAYECRTCRRKVVDP